MKPNTSKSKEKTFFFVWKKKQKERLKPEHGDTVTRMPAELPQLRHFGVGEVIGERENPKEERRDGKCEQPNLLMGWAFGP